MCGGRGGVGDCFFNDTATTEIYTLSLHDALPILEAEISSFPNASSRCQIRKFLIESLSTRLPKVSAI